MSILDQSDSIAKLNAEIMTKFDMWVRDSPTTARMTIKVLSYAVMLLGVLSKTELEVLEPLKPALESLEPALDQGKEALESLQERVYAIDAVLPANDNVRSTEIGGQSLNQSVSGLDQAERDRQEEELEEMQKSFEELDKKLTARGVGDQEARQKVHEAEIQETLTRFEQEREAREASAMARSAQESAATPHQVIGGPEVNQNPTPTLANDNPLEDRER
ncbi:MAG: hypothetical protein ACLP50_31750 [Solirubrobacteraceae bacterium]